MTQELSQPKNMLDVEHSTSSSSTSTSSISLASSYVSMLEKLKQFLVAGGLSGTPENHHYLSGLLNDLIQQSSSVETSPRVILQDITDILREIPSALIRLLLLIPENQIQKLIEWLNLPLPLTWKALRKQCSQLVDELNFHLRDREIDEVLLRSLLDTQLDSNLSEHLARHLGPLGLVQQNDLLLSQHYHPIITCAAQLLPFYSGGKKRSIPIVPNTLLTNITAETHSVKRYRLDEKYAELSKDQIIGVHYMNNGGFTLVATLLGDFWKDLGWVKQGNFLHYEKQVLALWACHYMVSRQPVEIEHAMHLYKVLTGFSSSQSVLLPISSLVTKQEQSHIIKSSEKFVHKVMNRWAHIMCVDINEFRERFFLRNAKLSEYQSHWLLEIQRKADDILLDTVPWAFDVVRYKWMEKPLRVKW